MRLGVLIAIGLVIGVVLGVGVASLRSGSDGGASSGDSGEVSIPTDNLAADEAVVREFLGLWSTYRTATFFAESTFERERPDGELLQAPHFMAQRPGDRLVRSIGGVSGYLGGVEVVCVSTESVDDGDTLDCRDVEGTDIDEDRRAELARLALLLAGSPPPYRVVELADGCWELQLTTLTADAPFGERTTYCFDAATGVLLDSETVFANGIIERVRVDAVRSDVTDADFTQLLTGAS